MENNFKNQFINRVKNKIINLSVESGLWQLLPVKGARIIMYHGVDLIENKKYNSRFIGIKNFEKQIIYFKKNFNIVSLTDYFEGSFKNTKFNIAITFDDGYRNNLKYALPILEKYKVPATFYITGLNTTSQKIIWSDFLDIASTFASGEVEIDGTIFYKKGPRKWLTQDNNYSLHDFIKNSSDSTNKLKHIVEAAFLSKIKDFREDPNLFDYWKLMTDEEIKAMSDSKYATIGSHGFYHNNLSSISHSKAMNEISMSKKYLENLTQKEINSIAYPDGSYTREIINDADKLGISRQLAVNYKYPEDIEDSRILSRYGIYPFQSTNKLGYLISQSRQ